MQPEQSISGQSMTDPSGQVVRLRFRELLHDRGAINNSVSSTLWRSSHTFDLFYEIREISVRVSSYDIHYDA